MFARVDPSFLPDADYVPLAMPTTDIELLWLLTRDGDVLRRYGLLSHVLAVDAPLPRDATRRDHPTVDATGRVSGSLTAKLFGSLLLGALGARTGLDLSAAGVRSVDYGYTDVTSDAVHLAALDSWLVGAAVVDRVGRAAMELLVADRLYVVVGLLRAAGLTVTARDERGAETLVDVPVVQDLVGAGVTVTAARARTSTLAFHGERPLVIAAKAARLRMDGRRGVSVDQHRVGGSQVRGTQGVASFVGGPQLRLA